MVGGSIGAAAVAIVGAPIVFHWVGMSGLFAIVGVLSILAIGVVRIVPDAAKPVHVPARSPRCCTTSSCAELRRAGAARDADGAVLVVPRLLVDGGLPVASHWKVYLPVMGPRS